MLHHEGIAAALRTTLDVLRAEDKASNAPIIAAAVALDTARTAKRSQKRVSKVQRKRERIAATLAQFDSKIPRQPENGYTAGALVRRGYLKRKGDGFVRTAKEFSV